MIELHKPTRDWTAGTTIQGGDKYPAIMCGKKVVWFTCLSSDRNELRQLCNAHNAALAAERERHQKIVDDMDSVIGEANRELAAEREKVQTLDDGLKQIASNGVRGSDTGWEGCLHPGIAKDARAKVKDAK